MTRSEQINELIAALAKAQLEYEPVHKDSANPYFNSMYADLGTIIAATQKALAKNGLAVTQWPIVENGNQRAGVVTELAHSSGQWQGMELLLPATGKGKDGSVKYDAQTIGSAITYARRYAYQAIVGVAAELDDDGNSIGEASGSKEAQRAVAERKIAEHAAKKTNGADDATVVMERVSEGLLALSGRGLAIVKSEMKADDRNFFNIRSHNGKWTMRADLADKFMDLCRRFEVGTIYVTSDSPEPHADRPSNERTAAAPQPSAVPSMLPKATLPPFEPLNGGHGTSTDPILMECTRVEKPGKKPFMDVTWNGRHHSSFDKNMWPQLETAKGLPVMLEVKESGKYSNVVRMLRCDGISFTDEQNQTVNGND